MCFRYLMCMRAFTPFLQRLGDVLYSSQLVPVIQQQCYCQWITRIHDYAWDHTSQLIRQLNPCKICRVWESRQECKDLAFHPGSVWDCQNTLSSL